MTPSRRKITVLKQICKLIPRKLVGRLAEKHGVDKQARAFSPWSHVVSLLYAQFAHALSLHDVCDALRNHSKALRDIRGARPPSHNGFSYANRNRNADMAEDLFWSVFAHLKGLSNTFGLGHGFCSIPYRFKRTINAVDSTTIQLFANCLSWAKHRRRKAAAKMHLSLNLHTFLPNFIIVKAANTHDSTEAEELCAGLQDGEIVVFDKAYVAFAHLHRLGRRGVQWVTRAKDDMAYKVVGQHGAEKGKIIRDERIKMTTFVTAKQYPGELRRIEALVDVNGVEKVMVFITNNFDWAPGSIADIYKSRWAIEVFFKQIKQTLQIADFLGYNENAVRWQVWTAMTAYLLQRFLAHVHGWEFSFPRICTVLRSVLWARFDIVQVIKGCGTAGAPKRLLAAPDQGFLPGFAPALCDSG